MPPREPKSRVDSAGAKQPEDEPDKGWLVLLASLVLVVLVVCAVWYARASACPWPAAAPPEIAMLVCAGGPA
jgi:hypothetical protein